MEDKFVNWLAFIFILLVMVFLFIGGLKLIGVL